VLKGKFFPLEPDQIQLVIIRPEGYYRIFWADERIYCF